MQTIDLRTPPAYRLSPNQGRATLTSRKVYRVADAVLQGYRDEAAASADEAAAAAAGVPSIATLSATYASYKNLARNPDEIIVGAVTRDANGAATSAGVVWPDGSPGTYTATTVSTAFPGAVDAYTITYGSPVTKTYTQPAVTRDSAGAATTVPAITVT